MLNSGLDEAQAGIKIAGRNINNLRYTDDTTLMAESKELKSLLIKVKEESEEVGLKLNIQKTKFMASGPISSVQSPSHVWLFATPWTATCQASMSITNSLHLVASFHGKQKEKQWKQWETLYLGVPKSLQMVTVAMKLKDACSLEEELWPI